MSAGDDGVVLTPDFRRVLGQVFRQVDLDGSGTLSRTEFNLFNWRTSGEEVQVSRRLIEPRTDQAQKD